VEILFSPWRHAYVTSAKEDAGRCILCRIFESGDDESNLVLLRAHLNFVLINRFPYNSGHLMIVPNRHCASLSALTSEERAELIELTGRAETIMQADYAAQGFNMGINLGIPAGAGIPGPLHLHIVPRWAGDTNFMTVVGETRLLPEDVATTFARLRPRFQAIS
jgi:ATP adenylyltransferase